MNAWELGFIIGGSVGGFGIIVCLLLRWCKQRSKENEDATKDTALELSAKSSPSINEPSVKATPRGSSVPSTSVILVKAAPRSSNVSASSSPSALPSSSSSSSAPTDPDFCKDYAKDVAKSLASTVGKELAVEVAHLIVPSLVSASSSDLPTAAQQFSEKLQDINDDFQDRHIDNLYRNDAPMRTAMHAMADYTRQLRDQNQQQIEQMTNYAMNANNFNNNNDYNTNYNYNNYSNNYNNNNFGNFSYGYGGGW